VVAFIRASVVGSGQGSVHVFANYGGRVGWSNSPAGALLPAGRRNVLAARIVCYERCS